MIVCGDCILDCSDDEKQLLYDSVIQYMFSESKIGKSDHFASEIHMQESIKAGNVAVKMRDEWKKLIH